MHGHSIYTVREMNDSCDMNQKVFNWKAFHVAKRFMLQNIQLLHEEKTIGYIIKSVLWSNYDTANFVRVLILTGDKKDQENVKCHIIIFLAKK